MVSAFQVVKSYLIWWWKMVNAKTASTWRCHKTGCHVKQQHVTGLKEKDYYRAESVIISLVQIILYCQKIPRVVKQILVYLDRLWIKMVRVNIVNLIFRRWGREGKSVLKPSVKGGRFMLRMGRVENVNHIRLQKISRFLRCVKTKHARQENMWNLMELAHHVLITPSPPKTANNASNQYVPAAAKS